MAANPATRAMPGAGSQESPGGVLRGDGGGVGGREAAEGEAAETANKNLNNGGCYAI